MGSGLIEQVVRALELSGLDLTSLGLGWARAAPVVALVPGFGLRALPGPVRALLALSLAAAIAPAVGADPSLTSRPPIPALIVAFAQGLPVAIAAAVPLWAATMAGGVIDDVRGAGNSTISMPSVEGRPTPFGVLMGLLASALFLSTGGPARIASALATTSTAPANLSLLRATLDIAAGIQIAIAVAAPVLAASVVIEIGGALIARAASPAQIHSLLAPIRSLAILAVAAIVLDRLAGLVSLALKGLGNSN